MGTRPCCFRHTATLLQHSETHEHHDGPKRMAMAFGAESAAEVFLEVLGLGNSGADERILPPCPKLSAKG